MSNEIKKPSDEASEVSVARYLMQQFPEWKGQLKSLVRAHEMPFQYFCEKEAAYRLGELGISDTIHDYASMVSFVANELLYSETYLDGDVADQIATSVLDKDFCLDLKDEKQVLFLEENYFKSELLLTLTGLKSDIPFLASFVCKTNIKKSNRNMEASFQKVLENHETDCCYITTKELQALFLSFQKDYRDNMSEVKEVFEGNESSQDSETALDEEYYMKWHTGIASEKDYNHFVAACLLNPDSVINYEQAAHLFYRKGKDTVMVELQVPTGRMSMDGSIHSPWIDVFRVKDMQDYDTSDEIDSVLHEGEIIFKNAKELMLQVARENI